jgi:hypothetical protein
MAEKKFVCNMEGCELQHCKRCGRHYEEGENERQGECPGCTVQMASDATETIVKGFGGNYEKAAKFYGW